VRHTDSRLIMTTLAALALAPLLVVAGGVLFRAEGGPGGDAAAAPVVGPVPDDPAERVAVARARVERLPGDWTAWTALGHAYLDTAGHGGDPALLDEADAAFERSLAERGEGNADALAGRSATAGARHEFTLARDLGERAVAADPYDAAARGVLADALLELGEYEAGFAQVQRMLDLRPDVASYSRASYVFELRGDPDGARSAMERALALATTPDDAEFAAFHLADLASGHGDLDAAERYLDEGLRRAPGSTELLLGRARVLAARGDEAGASAAYRRVVEELPDADHHVEYGEFLESRGRVALAREHYTAADAATARATAAGVVPDVEVALHLADRGRAAEALAVAERQYAQRRSIDVEDAYAWALHAAGRHEEALEHVRAAQRLGTRDALVSYHRGMIEAALGLTPAARASLQEALELDPHFSARHAPIARQTLADLARSG